MKKSLIIYGSAIGLLLTICSFVPIINPSISENKLVLGKDTISFSANTTGNWDVLSIYFNEYSTDSVDFELILVQRAGRMGGLNEKLIGNITNRIYVPNNAQSVTFTLLFDNIWELRITKIGECYLRQVKGSGIKQSDMPGNPDILPIKVRYSRK